MANILLLDDDTNVNVALSATVKSGGHQVVSLFDGSKLLTHMTDIDLVITDVIMPNVDGIEVLNAMKKEYPNIPVIVISGGGRVSADMYLKSAKVLGARAIMQKPIDNDLLLQTIDEVLAESQA